MRGRGYWRRVAGSYWEELGLHGHSFRYIWSTPHSTPFEEQTIHYYLCDEWSGIPVCNEAEEIFWITTGELGVLGFEIDREVVRRLILLMRELP